MARNTLRKWFALGVTLLVFNTTVVLAQDDQDSDPATVEPSTSSESSAPVVGSGPWGNTTTTASPSRGSNSNAAGASGTAARPVGGSTTLDLPDPINPDVPFDANMNIAFLVIGLVFAFVVYRKKFAVKSEPLTK